MKSFNVKIFDRNGILLRTLPRGIIRTSPTFSGRRNGGYGECVLDLALPFDDFSAYFSGMDIVEIESISDFHPEGITVYSGFISDVLPYYRAGSSGVRVTMLGKISLLAFDYYKNGSSFSVTHTTVDPAVIIKAIINHARGVWNTDSGSPVVVVSDTSQDGYETNNTTWSPDGDGSKNLYAGTTAGGQDMDIGIIFAALDIPQGATIVSATVSGYGYGDSGSNPCKMLIKGFAENHAQTFAAGGSNRPSTRQKTTASVAWEEDFPFSFGTRTSPDIKTVLQEIIDRPGWQRGNNLGLVLENNASAVSTILALQDFANTGTNKLTLTVSWTYLSTLINYDVGGTTIETVGSNVSITHADQKWIDAIKTAAAAAGAGFYYLVDRAGVFHFRANPTEATHSFILGKHIEEIEPPLNYENIVNAVQVRYTSGTVDVSDATSIEDNFRRGAIVNDPQLTSVQTATNRGNKEVTDNKDPKKAIRMVINSTYDIDSIVPGQSCKVRNVPANLPFLGENMIIEDVKWELNRVTLQLGFVKTDIAAAIASL